MFPQDPTFSLIANLELARQAALEACHRMDMSITSYEWYRGYLKAIMQVLEYVDKT